MKLYFLDLGALECDKNWIVAMSTYATADNQKISPVWTKMPVYAVLIDHPEGKFLFDLGCDTKINQIMQSLGKHQCRSFPYVFTKEQTFEHQLSLTETKISDISAVVLSHMHYDHVGNLPLFKNIPVYVQAEEYEDVFINNAGIASLYFDQFTKNPDVTMVPVHERFTLADGITVLPFSSGHCKGNLGLLVQMSEDTFLFPSDLAYCQENYGYPIKPNGKVYDSLGIVKQLEYVHQLADEYHAKVIFPHDVHQFATLKKAPLFYE